LLIVDLSSITPVAFIRKQNKYKYIINKYLFLIVKSGAIMPRPSKLMPEIQQKNGQNLSIGFTYSIAANSVGIIYQMFNEWMKMGRQRNLGDIISFINMSKNVMLME